MNSLLNYGYGILYSRLWAVLTNARLNVNVGFLHKPQPGKAGLLYDFIEEFRAAAVDRTVFSCSTWPLTLTPPSMVSIPIRGICWRGRCWNGSKPRRVITASNCRCKR